MVHQERIRIPGALLAAALSGLQSRHDISFLFISH
jgi:hypothetical protein